MRALHSVLNMPEYAMTEFWIYLGFSTCWDSEYDRVLNMPELQRVPNILQYGWMPEQDVNMPEHVLIYDNKQDSEYARVLNVSDAVHSIRSLHNITSSDWDKDVFRTLPNI